MAAELLGCLLVKRQLDGSLLRNVVVETEALITICDSIQ
ncbi:hypothetical protein SynWH8101_1807 [Synechococcus sp. WH 8101]|nr:hypothetical protein SynWH8101_1807 [Synechococcus sp. WH 8101]QNI45637.1 hypothetical protein SynRCC2555_01856 [Synechococcus sp. WH 8101]